MNNTPERGEIVWLDFMPRSGRGMPWRRPVLVLSPIEYNEKVGLALICPVTTDARGYPFEHEIPVGLPVTGVILADQVKCVDWKARRSQTACRVPDSLVKRVSEDILLLLPEPGR